MVVPEAASTRMETKGLRVQHGTPGSGHLAIQFLRDEVAKVLFFLFQPGHFPLNFNIPADGRSRFGGHCGVRHCFSLSVRVLGLHFVLHGLSPN